MRRAARKVMPALVAGIHVLDIPTVETGMAATVPAMTLRVTMQCQFQRQTP
jgi:hypothetical protein